MSRKAKKAIFYLDSSLFYFQITEERTQEYRTRVKLAEAYLLQKDGTKAIAELKKSIPGLEEEKILEPARVGYQLLAQAYGLLNQPDSANSYLHKSIMVTEEIQKITNKRLEQEVRSQFEVDLAQKDKDLAELKLNKEKNKVYFISTLFGLFTLFLILIVVRHRKYKKEKEKTTLLEVEAAQKHLSHTREILQNQSGLILEKNRIITELKGTLQTHFGEDNLSIEKFNHLLEQKILTKSDWENFKSSFKLLYADFIPSMKSRYGGITEAELRMLCMFKLDLSLEEMADMLGILPRSMERTVNRFTNKYGSDPSLSESLS